MLKTRKSFLCLFTLLPFALHATPAEHVVVAPQCLVQKANLTHQTIAKRNSLSLLSVDQRGINRLMTAKIARYAKPCGGFVDVTPDWENFAPASADGLQKAEAFLQAYTQADQNAENSVSKDYAIQYSTQVNQLLKAVNPQNIWNDLTTLTNFQNRHANSTLGVAAADWFVKQIKDIASANNRDDVTVFKVATSGYKQPSVVAKIGKSSEPGIVVGGHMDTIVMFNNRQPGADDDGSGSSTILEAARVILSSGMTFKKPLYFIWYAAEEEGLIGSGQVVKHFKSNNIPVEAAIQFDMTGYSNKNDPTLWLLSDNTNKKLTSFVEELAKTYVKQPVKYTACGYGCSDHARWHNAGIPAAAPFEAEFGKEDPYIHSTRDTMDVLSVTHMTNFAKLAISYAVELAEPVK